MDALAAARLATLRHALWSEGPPPAAPHAAWGAELGLRPEPVQGVQLAGLDPAWREALAHAGVPLTATGGLAFERLFTIGDVAAPTPGPTTLVLPPIERFAALTSLPLKPLRMAMAGVFGVRLHLATGVHLFLTRRQAILMNTAAVPRSGFLHGPRRGMRAALALEPGQAQVVPL